MTVQIRDAIWIFVGRVGATLGGVVALRVATEILGPEEIGRMFLVLSTTSLPALVLAPAGLFFTRHIVEWHRENLLLKNGERFPIRAKRCLQAQANSLHLCLPPL